MLNKIHALLFPNPGENSHTPRMMMALPFELIDEILSFRLVAFSEEWGPGSTRGAFIPLMLVCRRARALVEPHLYTHIRIASARRLHKLADFAMSSTLSSDPEPPSALRHTRSLEIGIYHERGKEPDWMRRARALELICWGCTRLEVLIIGNGKLCDHLHLWSILNERSRSWHLATIFPVTHVLTRLFSSVGRLTLQIHMMESLWNFGDIRDRLVVSLPVTTHLMLSFSTPTMLNVELVCQLLLAIQSIQVCIITVDAPHDENAAPGPRQWFRDLFTPLSPDLLGRDLSVIACLQLYERRGDDPWQPFRPYIISDNDLDFWTLGDLTYTAIEDEGKIQNGWDIWKIV